jgi:hypothetical protein
MRAAMQALGHAPERFDVLIVQLVTLLRDGQPVRMSKRRGEFVLMEELLEEVGRDAARFTFLTRRHDSPLEFDLAVATRQSSDNPVSTCSTPRAWPAWQDRGRAGRVAVGRVDFGRSRRRRMDLTATAAVSWARRPAARAPSLTAWRIT